MALLGGTLQNFCPWPFCESRSRFLREDRIICAGDVGTELYFVAVARPKLFQGPNSRLKKSSKTMVVFFFETHCHEKGWVSWSHKELTAWWSGSEGDSYFLNMSWLTLDSLRMPRPHCQQNSDKWKMIGSVSQQFLRNLHSVLLVHPQENKHSTWEDAIPKGKAFSTP